MESFGFAFALHFLLFSSESLVRVSSSHSSAKGRIKAFDDVLLMYGNAINTGHNLQYAIDEIKRLSYSPQFNREFANYYIEILELIKSTGSSKIIRKENDRLNVIITSASNQRGAEGEMEYAIIRRNILNAFTEAAVDDILYGKFQSQSPGDATFQRPSVEDDDADTKQTKEEM